MVLRKALCRGLFPHLKRPPRRPLDEPASHVFRQHAPPERFISGALGKPRWGTIASGLGEQHRTEYGCTVFHSDLQLVAGNVRYLGPGEFVALPGRERVVVTRQDCTHDRTRRRRRKLAPTAPDD